MSVGGAAIAGAVLVGALLGAACSGGDDGSDAIVESDGFAVLDAWVRPTPPGSDSAAFYVTIENRDAPVDRLIGASSDRCMVVTPHVTEVDADEVATMRDAPGDLLDLAPGRRVTMEPLGLHLMCLGLDEPLVVDDEPAVTLRFAEREPLAVRLVVEQR